MKKILIVLTMVSMALVSVACNKSTPQPEQESGNQEQITLEQAKEIALKHAKLTEKEIEYLKTEQSMDDKIEKYDIEFSSGNKQYDYEINVNTAEIIEFDNEIEDYEIGKQEANTQNKITIEQAKEIALKHANLKIDQVKFTEHENDMDNNISKYDIEFTYENVKYNYEIDANTGDVISFEKE